jgi:hypothetical protein
MFSISIFINEIQINLKWNAKKDKQNIWHKYWQRYRTEKTTSHILLLEMHHQVTSLENGLKVCHANFDIRFIHNWQNKRNFDYTEDLK